MKQLDEFLAHSPCIVFEWNDAETGAQAWLVINSLKGGAAGGGTRMRKGLSKEEVVSLAKVMEIKFNVCGPSIGGAKSGINFDPSDPRKEQVLYRWFEAVTPLLKYYYGTGGDLNVDEVRDVFPITEELGIYHPQEGVLNGHFGYNMHEKQQALVHLDRGCKMPVVLPEYSPDFGEGAFNVADMITGYGVSESVKHFYQIYRQESLEAKRVIIQGWGNVASAAALYLAMYGAKIIAILDREHSLVEPNGLSLDAVRTLFVQKDGNRLNAADMKPNAEVLNDVWDIPSDIFIPAAASRIVTIGQMQRLIQNGLQLISCGANVPFVEDAIIFGDTSRILDRQLFLIPDFISNCGMARTFHYLMAHKGTPTEKDIFSDVSDTIASAIQSVQKSGNEGLGFFEKALNEFIKI